MFNRKAATAEEILGTNGTPNSSSASEETPVVEAPAETPAFPFIGAEARHPYVNRVGTIVAINDTHVAMEFKHADGTVTSGLFTIETVKPAN